MKWQAGSYRAFWFRPDAFVEPVGIEADRSAGIITIAWGNGHRSEYPAELLRWACPCAQCSGEWGRPGVLAALTSLPPDETILADVQMVGGYAIMPVWRSGHMTGIYSFEYLWQLCPCGQHADRDTMSPHDTGMQ